ncbi:hypothetical protein PFISCL1PPCAC_26046, partial [Pristionchus fissidentatus]
MGYHPRDDIQQWRDDGLTCKQISRLLWTRKEIRLSESAVRRQLNRKEKRPKPYSPSTVPKDLHPTVRQLIEKLYEKNGTITVTKIIEVIKTETDLKVSEHVVHVWRDELGFRRFRLRYGHMVRLANRLVRVDYCQRALDNHEQFLTHSFSDESWIYLEKTSKTIFVRDRAHAVQSAPKYPVKLLVWGSI